LADVFYQFAPPADVKADFRKRYPAPKDAPFLTSPLLVPGFYLGESPDLSPDSPLRKWLQETKTPFYIMTNYATGAYTDKNGAATYERLRGRMAEQFMGYIHGEAVGTTGVGMSDKPLGETRARHAAALAKYLRDKQAEDWGKIYKTKVAADHFDKSVSCLSV